MENEEEEEEGEEEKEEKEKKEEEAIEGIGKGVREDVVMGSESSVRIKFMIGQN
jgi:microcompartment protein CcmK/EutM